MRAYQTYLVVALTLGIGASAYAQSAEPVAKLPSEIEFKAPLESRCTAECSLVR